MTTTQNLTTGQHLGPFVVAEITDDKVCLYDASAAEYRHAKAHKWLKKNSPILASIIKAGAQS